MDAGGSSGGDLGRSKLSVGAALGKRALADARALAPADAGATIPPARTPHRRAGLAQEES